MESLFDADFSLVRINTNARAAESARAIQARAYTLGRDIVFGFGQYQPHTSNGRQLLTHELIHTVQQEGSPDAITDSLRVSSPDDASEREAAHIAHGILIGSLSHDSRNGYETPAHKLRRIGGIHHTSSGVIHRDTDPSLKAKAENDLGPPPKGPFEIRGLSVVINAGVAATINNRPQRHGDCCAQGCDGDTREASN